MKVSSFDILKRMSVENLDIRLSTSENLRNMNVVHKGKDTDITIGVAGNVIGAVMNNDLHLCLLIWNKEQFQATKAKMEDERVKGNPHNLSDRLMSAIVSDDRCPMCLGELDTGWECNDCGYDAKPWIDASKARHDAAHDAREG